VIPDEIAGYVRKYHIKSIVDLRMPGTDDLTLNPKIGEIQAEKNAVAKIEGLIILVTHPSSSKQKKIKLYKNNG
jgi:hypothetical protein